MEQLTTTQSIDERAVAAADSEAVFENLLNEFRPFLHGCVSRHTSVRDHDQWDEMYSIAMLAFYEAVQNYRLDLGHFFPFANGIVKRRLIDGLRKLYRQDRQMSYLDDEDDEAGAQSGSVSAASIQQHEVADQQQRLREEMEHYRKELSAWDITMDRLAKNSPKHAKLRETYNSILNCVLDDADLLQTIQIKRYLPVKKIAEISKVPQKTVERGRIYLLATLVIRMGDYPLLSEYVKNDDGR